MTTAGAATAAMVAPSSTSAEGRGSRKINSNPNYPLQPGFQATLERQERLALTASTSPSPAASAKGGSPEEDKVTPPPRPAATLAKTVTAAALAAMVASGTAPAARVTTKTTVTPVMPARDWGRGPAGRRSRPGFGGAGKTSWSDSRT